MENINKLSLPATILLASIILGGFYYFSELNKQKSIEKQQTIVENEKLFETISKSECVDEATQSAIDFYKTNCTYNCKEGQYYVANYDNAYSRCLQGKGLK